MCCSAPTGCPPTSLRKDPAARFRSDCSVPVAMRRWRPRPLKSRAETGGTELTDGTHENLDRLLRSGGIRLGRAQRDRLDWLVGQYGTPTFDDLPDSRRNGVIILKEPLSGAAAELFYRSLT